VTFEGKSEFMVELVVLKDLPVQKEGYLRAVQRLKVAVAAGDVDGVYIYATEAVNWLVSIAGGSNPKGDQDVEALRHARNRSHHTWASIVFHNEEGEWFWRPASQLPQPEDPRNAGTHLAPIYARRLGGKPMLDVFERLAPKIANAKTSVP
jgi:hypothetical protein